MKLCLGNASAHSTTTQRGIHSKQETPEFVMMQMPEQENAFSHWFTQSKGQIPDLCIGMDPHSVSLMDLETQPRSYESHKSSSVVASPK